MDIASRNFFSFVTESGSQYVFERTGDGRGVLHRSSSLGEIEHHGDVRLLDRHVEPGRRLRFRTLDGGHVTRTGRVRTIVVHAGTA